jgi:DNA-binding CsgD family transcriptional regulator
MTILSTLAYDVVDDAMVVFHAPGKPANQDLERCIADTQDAAPYLRGSLVLAGNAALTGSQRRQISGWFRGAKIKVAVLTGSTGVRKSARALKALGHEYRVFGRRDLHPAIEHLGFRPDTRSRIRKIVAEFRAAIDPRLEVYPEPEVASTQPGSILTGVHEFSTAFGLSPRESEAVFALVSAGSRREVAKRLGVSEGSVHTYLSRACRKVGIRSEMDLLRAIIRFLDAKLERRSR